MRQGITKKTALLLTSAAVAAALALAAIAQAGPVQQGDLVVYFGGGISPSTLPRSKPAPVSVEMNGSVKTTDKSVPPAWRGSRCRSTATAPSTPRAYRPATWPRSPRGPEPPPSGPAAPR